MNMKRARIAGAAAAVILLALLLWRLLGGTNNHVKAYAGGIDLFFSHEQLREQTWRFLRRGFRAIKIKVGRDRLAEDVERVQLAREVVGPDVTLMADANMGWQVDQAIRAGAGRFGVGRHQQPGAGRGAGLRRPYGR